MTDKTKDSILLQITEVLGPLLERQGFVRRRHRFERPMATAMSVAMRATSGVYAASVRILPFR
ncbi:hypothetical protein [Xanthomonas sp. CFBP 8445]|uniref:hypothetical protein n=1 Tax=Xanthomonas sp. CFBP 8445 TaxID=2971236 RepID=UPI0021E02D11|nr:hypothetical protein [Xanthomonas sp. CFBP 8445]UYC12566.1 hypothetical protein NUG21_02115 [Xanthomonas sp. CFBP 8445]